MTKKPETAPAEMAREEARPTRRSFLFGLGIALNALAVTLFAIPILGYLLSPLRRFA